MRVSSMQAWALMDLYVVAVAVGGDCSYLSRPVTRSKHTKQGWRRRRGSRLCEQPMEIGLGLGFESNQRLCAEVCVERRLLASGAWTTWTTTAEESTATGSGGNGP